MWYQATTPGHLRLAPQLLQRLERARPGLNVLLTGTEEVLAAAGCGAGNPAGSGPAGTAGDGMIRWPLPRDDGAAARAFVEHWRPDIGIWTAGDLRPALLATAGRRGVALFLVDADETLLAGPGWRIVPSATRSALRRFEAILARTPATETHLRRRLGLRDAPVAVSGPLQVASRPLPCNRSDHEELAALLRGRPVWLAAHLDPREIGVVLAANAEITRTAHRCLLVIAPDRPAESAPFRDALQASGLRHLCWSEGALPDETIEVILADTPGELGLWYRIAPISFMGSSLIPGGPGSDPNEPAAHGSAILYGPGIRDHLGVYARYAEAGAARIVRDAQTLAAAVRQLIPPDQSAAMAHAAWDVATRSAAAMDQLIDMVLTALDRRGAG
ncbi:MAG: glycosyltransferase N-terminal domain-containing protein [Roseovarius sp.]